MSRNPILDNAAATAHAATHPPQRRPATTAAASEPVQPHPLGLPPINDQQDLLAEGVGDSWLPADLTAVDTEENEAPTLFRNSAGQSVLYPGRLHWWSGEPESCKTWLLDEAAAQTLRDGRKVLYLDYEDDARGKVARLQALGIDAAHHHQEGQLRYVRPVEPLIGQQGRITAAETHLMEHCQWGADLAIIDGVTEAMTLEGLDLERNRDIATWLVALPRRLARAGAAVAAIDHVTKSKEGRGRWAIGGQHKLAAVDGAAFTVEVIRPLGRAGLEPTQGHVRIKVAKDRRGHLRGAAKGDVLAEARITAYPDGGVTVTLDPPGAASPETDPHRAKVIEHLAIYDGAGKSSLRDLGNSDAIDQAIKGLVADGHVRVERLGRTHAHTLTPEGRTAWAHLLDQED